MSRRSRGSVHGLIRESRGVEIGLQALPDGASAVAHVRPGDFLWELFLPGVEPGARYKFEIRTADGSILLKADPFAFAAEAPPKTASVMFRSQPGVKCRQAECVATMGAFEISMTS